MTLAGKLIGWYRRNRRDLPWRRTKEPYRILVSEIMLQQTRAAAVVPYYERFLERFPTAGALAAAPEQDVLAAWAGLGYYSRARNLHRAARRVVEAGGFPATFAGLMELPGIGEYTAAAVASIAHGLPHAVLDGNVERVLARLRGIEANVKSSSTRAQLRSIAADLLDRRRPGEFNQALMELGATVCVPRDPDCAACPLRNLCNAFETGRQRELPVLPARRPVARIERTLLVVENEGRILMKQRSEADGVMPGFWDLPFADEIPHSIIGGIRGRFRHMITHHQYEFRVAAARVAAVPPRFEWIARDSWSALPVTTIARKAIVAGGFNI